VTGGSGETTYLGTGRAPNLTPDLSTGIGTCQTASCFLLPASCSRLPASGFQQLFPGERRRHEFLHAGARTVSCGVECGPDSNP
jgi:hypothetical protein